MPPALAVLAPIAGAVVGGLIQNGQNKSNQQNQQNAQNNAQNFQLQQQQQAEQFMQQQRNAALQAYQQYIKQNPNPVQGWGNIQAPMLQGPQSVGGGVLGSNGMPEQGTMPQQAQPQINPASLMQMLQLMYSPSPAQQPQPKPQPAQQPTQPMQPRPNPLQNGTGGGGTLQRGSGGYRL